MDDEKIIQKILDFWFQCLPKDRDGKFLDNDVDRTKTKSVWFAKSDELDAKIREEYGELFKTVRNGKYEEWKKTEYGSLAAIILFDQFSRQIFRDKAEAFDTDELARSLTYHMLNTELNKRLPAIMQAFAFMPLMHSEDLKDHEVGNKVFEELTQYFTEEKLGRPLKEGEQKVVALCNGYSEFMKKHTNDIKKFGRYPGRNKALGRKNTPEEKEHLAAGGAY